MDISKTEIELAQQAEAEAKQATVCELMELQLAYVGGGSGVDIFH